MLSLKDRYAFKNPIKRFLVFLFDCLGSLLYLPWRICKNRTPPLTPKRILAIRIDQIGDTILSWPAIRALHHKFKGADIDVLASEVAGPLFGSCDEVHEVISFKANWFSGASWGEQWKEACRLKKLIKSRNYDVAIDFRGDLRTILLLFFAGIPCRLGYGRTGGGFLLTYCGEQQGIHQINLNVELLKYLSVKELPEEVDFPVTAEDRKQFKSKFGDELSPLKAPRIVFHFGSARDEKKWSSEDVKAVLHHAVELNASGLILIGSQEDKQALALDEHLSGAILDLRGRASLHELIALMEYAQLFVGLDSGPGHLAALQGLSVVSVFIGEDDPKIWHPWAQKMFLVQSPTVASVTEAITQAMADLSGTEKVTP